MIPIRVFGWWKIDIDCVCVYIGLNIALVPIFSACIVVHTEIGTKKSNKIYTDAIYLFIVIYFHSK